MPSRTPEEPFDLAITGGTVVLPEGPARINIGVRRGLVSWLGSDTVSARKTIDAAERLVLPGGVDSHCHMDQQPWEGRSTADDFRSGTLSALCGGNTTVLPFAMQMRGQSLRAIVEDYHQRAGPKAHIDYGFHLIVGDPTPRVWEGIAAAHRAGLHSIKLYLTYEGLKLDDYEVLSLLALARREGVMIMVHAENDACIRWLTDRLLESRKSALRYHVTAHSAVGEREAAYRAISFAELIETPILIVHVSSVGVVEEVRRAQARGLPIYAETCPQYLFLSAEDIDTADMSGAKCVCTPPPRERSNQPGMWRGILDGTLGVFSSDHSPWNYADKIAGGPDTPFNKVLNGIPGIETACRCFFGDANRRTADLEPIRGHNHEHPARLYGLYLERGHRRRIRCGFRDLGPGENRHHPQRDAASRGRSHAIRGMQVKGWPVMTISRGEVIFEDGRVTSTAGRGRFLACERPFARKGDLNFRGPRPASVRLPSRGRRGPASSRVERWW
jgi:dihydropyrimidinase